MQAALRILGFWSLSSVVVFLVAKPVGWGQSSGVEAPRTNRWTCFVSAKAVSNPSVTASNTAKQCFPFAAGVRPSSRALPSPVPGPGVYVTRPYACIVAVPDLVEDSIGVPPAVRPEMPLVIPHLDFVPRTRPAQR